MLGNGLDDGPEKKLLLDILGRKTHFWDEVGLAGKFRIMRGKARAEVDQKQMTPAYEAALWLTWLNL